MENLLINWYVTGMNNIPSILRKSRLVLLHGSVERSAALPGAESFFWSHPQIEAISDLAVSWVLVSRI